MSNTSTKQLRRSSPLVVAVVGAVAFSGCAPEKPSDADSEEIEVEADETEREADENAVVARVSGEEITREEFNRRIDGLAEFARSRLQSEERREEFLARVAEFEVMADVAEEQNLGNHPRVRNAMKETMADLMVNAHVDERVAIDEIEQETQRAYFREHRERYVEPERRRIARLVVDTEQRAEQLLQRWRDRDHADSREAANAFRRFAFRHSAERATGDEGGDAGWWTEEDGLRFGEDVFEWEVGSVQGPFDEDGRYVLAMVVEIDEATEPDFEDVEREVTNDLYERRRRLATEQFVDRLREDADIQIHEERLGGLDAPPAEAPPPMEELPRVGLDEITAESEGSSE